MATSEREYPLITLEAGPIGGPARETVTNWIQAFEPLDFEAGRKAKAWLETNLAAELLPMKTFLVFNDRDENELYGFMVLDEIEIKVAPYDIPIMQVRHAISDPRAERHPATKLVWIARSQSSPAGLGSELFDYALLEAKRSASCALMVDAFDEQTAKELWIDRYELREPRDGGEEWSSLWHSVGEPNQTFQ